MLPVTQFFSRRMRKQSEPRTDVLAEEYEWVFGKKPNRDPEPEQVRRQGPKRSKLRQPLPSNAGLRH